MSFRTGGLRGKVELIVLVSVTVAPIARGASLMTISILLVSIRSIATIVCVSIFTRVFLVIPYLSIFAMIILLCV